MWEFLNEVFKSGGLFALAAVVEAVVIWFLFKTLRAKDSQLLEMSEKRVADVTESKEDYEELSKNLDKAIDLLIKVFRKHNGE
jgi:hypothetical protein